MDLLRSRTASLTWAVPMLMLSTSGLAQAAEPDAAENRVPRPNFVLLMADDQGWGDVGYNGHPVLKTPALDEMAAAGLRFDRFYAAAPVCSPTRGSVLTGRHPNRFGCFSWGHRLRPQELTVAEALKTAGYTTGHFGKWHLGSVRSGSPVSPGGSGFDEWLSTPNFYENDPLMSRRGTVVEVEGESSVVAVDAALEFIRRAAKDGKPFLAVIWFGSPHTPHVAAEDIRALYRDQPEKLQHYYGEITGIDRAVGKLREALQDLQPRWPRSFERLAHNTLIWYTSDNGAQGPGSTGGLRGRKGSLWEGGLRVPAIIEWPARIAQPRAIDIPCGSVDIYPTLVELAGAKLEEQPQPLDGVSLVPLIDGKLQERRKPLGFWVYPAKGQPMRSRDLLQQQRVEAAAGEAPTVPAEDRDAGKIAQQYPLDERPGHAAWIDGRWKLHRLPGRGHDAQFELYDLVADRAETNDVSGEHEEVVVRMQAALDEWQRSVLRSLNGEDY
ncbi:MAG: sulfatase-like hydrolase/transferase [Planctomycetes bacterium]|nr:sulfatase-like hydrolase/transferase [Planctomycetota bacterium]